MANRRIFVGEERAGGSEADTILIAATARCWRPCGMGAKYLPTIKDLKASQRFKQKQSPLHKFKKTPDASGAKKSKKN
jgi:hypothetical protein